MDYGKALRISRAIAGLQQKELADRTNLDASYISMIEMGKRKPSLKAARLLSSALGIPTHLFTLLATESGDVEHLAPVEIEEIGMLLTRLLLPNTRSK
jgi:transcriptional regulator with XRE-family HTH domain